MKKYRESLRFYLTKVDRTKDLPQQPIQFDRGSQMDNTATH